MQLLRQEQIGLEPVKRKAAVAAFGPEQQKIKAYYSGGTLAYEAAMLVKAGLNLEQEDAHQEGYILKAAGHEIIDLGDDIYTQGKPHPMIDPTKRIELLKQAGEDPETAVIFVRYRFWCGSHQDMAVVAPTIKSLKEAAQAAGRELAVIATIVELIRPKTATSKQRF